MLAPRPLRRLIWTARSCGSVLEVPVAAAAVAAAAVAAAVDAGVAGFEAPQSFGQEAYLGSLWH